MRRLAHYTIHCPTLGATRLTGSPESNQWFLRMNGLRTGDGTCFRRSIGTLGLATGSLASQPGVISSALPEDWAIVVWPV